MRLPIRCALLLVPLANAGCAGGPALGQLPAQEYRGHVREENGARWFRPCLVADGVDPEWWVTLTEASVAQYPRVRGRADAEGRLFVRWRAARTDAGEVGPKGPGHPALLVREILEARAPAPDDCR